MEKQKLSPVNLFFIFFKISSLTLGGGAVMLGLMEDEFVEKRKLLTSQEMVDIFSMVNSMPGVIGINSAVLIGRKLLGFTGAVTAALGILLPSFFIILFLSELVMHIRDKEVTSYAFLGLRAGAAGLISVVMVRMFRKSIKSWREWTLAISAFLELRVIGIPALWVIVISAVFGMILFRNDS